MNKEWEKEKMINMQAEYVKINPVRDLILAKKQSIPLNLIQKHPYFTKKYTKSTNI